MQHIELRSIYNNYMYNAETCHDCVGEGGGVLYMYIIPLHISERSHLFIEQRISVKIQGKKPQLHLSE